MQSTKRKLALLLGAALATMAFGATSASAATEVRDAETEELCSEVSPPVETGKSWSSLLFDTSTNYSSGGCTAKLTSPGYHHVGGWNGYRTNLCQSTFEVHVGPDGWGYANNFSFYSCDSSTVACPGSRIIAPAEYNPDPLNNGKGVFKYKNASTDLNIALCGKPTNETFWGLSSFDVKDDPGGQIWDHQQTDAPNGFWYYITGLDWRQTGGSALAITH